MHFDDGSELLLVGVDVALQCADQRRDQGGGRCSRLTTYAGMGSAVLAGSVWQKSMVNSCPEWLTKETFA